MEVGFDSLVVVSIEGFLGVSDFDVDELVVEEWYVGSVVVLAY